MKFIGMVLLMIVGCATLKFGPFRYPNIISIISSQQVVNEDGIYKIVYELPKGSIHFIYKISKTTKYTSKSLPFMIKYFDVKGNLIATQYDDNHDKLIDAMSGDMKKLNEILNFLNQEK